jgi:hypothetical protein
MKDLFSLNSSGYAQYRPVYPSALATYLASIVPYPCTAWDCGTGNGQMGNFLSYFKKGMNLLNHELHPNNI